MISLSEHLAPPVRLPNCFIDWLKERDAAHPEFTYIVDIGENQFPEMHGWHMKNNIIFYMQNGKTYSAKIITGRVLNNDDLDAAVGVDRSRLTGPALNVDVLPVNEKDFIDFDS